MQQTVTFTFQELLAASADALDEQLISFFSADETLTYEVRTPEGPRAEAPGLLIYISPKPGAAVPTDWGAVLDQHNLVWVGAQASGNEVHTARRVGFAQLAGTVAAKVTETTPARTYLSGFSGGGRVASMMMMFYPEQFDGALFICGADGMFNADEATVAQLAQVPLVFLTGTGDFNLEDTEMAISSFRRAGVDSAQLMVVEDLGHALPEAKDLDTALSSLNDGPSRAAGSTQHR